MSALREWFWVRFDQDAIALHVSPPGGVPWQATILWERIIRVCFKAGDWSTSDEIYIFTDERPESYVIPTEAEGGQAVWFEILERQLFDADMALAAAMATDQLMCSPLRPREVTTETVLYSPRQLPDLEAETICLTWDQIEADSIILHEGSILWREKTGWDVCDRFEEIAAILKHKYGRRLVDIVPTAKSLYALYGDSTASSFHVASVRESLGTDGQPETFHWMRLDEAVREGDAATLKAYLAQGGDPNIRSLARGSADTLLHVAARRRQPDMARMLIAAGADVNATDSLEKPPLVAALGTGFMPAAMRALENPRANPEALRQALEPERTTDLVRRLVLAGANLSGLNRPFNQLQGLVREMYQAPLALAARYGYTDALRFLLQQGADVDVEDYLGDTPLIMALRWGQAEAAHLLITAGADVNRQPYSPNDLADTQLLMVIKSERVDPKDRVPLIQRMIEAGANVNTPNAVGDSPLLTAVRFGTDHYYALIGTDTAGQVEWQVTTWPVQNKLPLEEIAVLIRVLRDAGADVGTCDRTGKTARDIASAAGLTELLPLL